MRLLQRHILMELIRVFAALLCILTVLLVFVGVFREVSESGLGPEQVIQILPFIVPSMMPFTIPATMLLTVCLVYGRWAADNEITASKAAGINVMSLLTPAFALAFLLSVASLLMTDQVIPWAVANIQQIVTTAMEDIFLDVLRSKHQMTDPKRGVSITVLDVHDRKLIRPTFRYQREGKTPVLIQAQEAEIKFDLEKREVVLDLLHGYLDLAGKQRIWFDHEQRSFPLPKELRVPKARHMTIRALNGRIALVNEELQKLRAQRDLDVAFALSVGEIDRLSHQDHVWFYHWFERPRLTEIQHLTTEKHSRFALAGSCFFFVLLGAPYSILQARRNFLTVFITCFLPILLVYYPVMLGLMNVSKDGKVEAYWAVWVANGILLVASIWLISRVRRN
ncbi:LptF/LptG family permease [Calycomorphotria hydatis]|uniref:Putative permease YjgP/YjgQ family protein n=1 Tax=Calycomorphotria hydatis TaxID=2528027 RepID=A0A517T9E8_9PLAN|nr:LptF/LptG family permease [Calycomorphotria hydatis]QDT65001.1 putative permease YjgP/YjgQ family protein [Calycomorphotria hydatis]